MLKRHEIQVLRRAEHTWSEVAALSGVSEKTARRIAAEEAVTTAITRRSVRGDTSADHRRLTPIVTCWWSADRKSGITVRRTAASCPPGGLRRREEGPVHAGADAAGPDGHAAGAIRRFAGRVFPARFSATCGSRIRTAASRRCTSSRRDSSTRGGSTSRWCRMSASRRWSGR